jgi:hypothetical protein
MYKEMYKELYKDIFNVKFLVILVIFLAGLYFYVYYSSNPLLLESLTTMNGELRCPNVLIQKDSKYYLYNSNIAEVPGVNPIMFNNLEEYTEFLDWQRGAGIRCPVLYLQNTYDAQGNRVYKARPSVSEAQGGLPPMVPVPPPLRMQALEDTTYGLLPTDNNVLSTGTTDPLEAVEMSNEHMLFSDNAMDPNWGGVDYTQSLVDTGFYQK